MVPGTGLGAVQGVHGSLLRCPYYTVATTVSLLHGGYTEATLRLHGVPKAEAVSLGMFYSGDVLHGGVLQRGMFYSGFNAKERV